MGIVDYFGSEIFHTQNWVKKESNLIAQNLHLDKRVDRKKQDVMRLKPCKSSVIYWLIQSIARQLQMFSLHLSASRVQQVLS